MKTQGGLRSLREARGDRFAEGLDLIKVVLSFEGKLGLIFAGIRSRYC
jgi:hypothetical protein